MSEFQFYHKLSHLPESAKSEVNDFIDFLLNKKQPKQKAKKPVFGCAKGEFKMRKDFDESLEDFSEYMK